MSYVLDLLEAATEIRLRQPELRAATAAVMRLVISEGGARAIRLYSLEATGSPRMIIAQGQTASGEEHDLDLLARSAAAGGDMELGDDGCAAVPFLEGRRLVGGLVVEAAKPDVVRLLALLFRQWMAAAENLHRAKAELVDENFQLREEIRQQFPDTGLVGASGAFRDVVASALRVAASSASVLITGETGTGKELLAHLVHNHSPRSNGPFVSVNCGSLAESLLQSELFGHVKGAFTGAVADHKGRFELADGGTIFLDEIGEIGPAMQVQLLRVLQEMEIVRVGDTSSRKLDVRVVAATNRDLEQDTRDRRFRQDLYYRLNVVQLKVPPLRQRAEDVPLLVEHFLSVHCQRHSRYVESISREALEIMRAYPWPGNIRELENCVEKMVVMATSPHLDTDLLPMALMAYGTDREEATSDAEAETAIRGLLRRHLKTCREAEAGDLYARVRAEWERRLFALVLEACDGNQTRAARLLGISRNTLHARLRVVGET